MEGSLGAHAVPWWPSCLTKNQQVLGGGGLGLLLSLALVMALSQGSFGVAWKVLKNGNERLDAHHSFWTPVYNYSSRIPRNLNPNFTTPFLRMLIALVLLPISSYVNCFSASACVAHLSPLTCRLARLEAT